MTLPSPEKLITKYVLSGRRRIIQPSNWPRIAASLATGCTRPGQGFARFPGNRYRWPAEIERQRVDQMIAELSAPPPTRFVGLGKRLRERRET